MSFLNFIKKYYFATNEAFPENKCRYMLTRRERKICIFILYTFMVLILPILFVVFRRKNLLIIFLLLYFFIEFVVNFNIFRILIIFFIYKKTIL